MKSIIKTGRPHLCTGLYSDDLLFLTMDTRKVEFKTVNSEGDVFKCNFCLVSNKLTRNELLSHHARYHRTQLPNAREKPREENGYESSATGLNTSPVAFMESFSPSLYDESGEDESKTKSFNIINKSPITFTGHIDMLEVRADENPCLFFKNHKMGIRLYIQQHLKKRDHYYVYLRGPDFNKCSLSLNFYLSKQFNVKLHSMNEFHRRGKLIFPVSCSSAKRIHFRLTCI